MKPQAVPARQAPDAATILFASVISVMFAIGTAAQPAGPGGTVPDDPEPQPVTDEWIVIEGDILVPPDYEPGLRSFRDLPWPGGWVPFEFDAAAGITASERADMLEAMDWWTTTTGVKFVYRSNEPGYILITRSDRAGVSSASVGYAAAERRVRIWDSHWAATGVVAHELCHGLGFWHEQTRPDRDTYVQIEWDNILTDDQHNFDIHPDGLTFGNPYDFESIMHYRACSFSICDSCASDDPDCRTITTLDPDQQDVIGQRDALSFWDVQDMINVYGNRHARYVEPGNGGGNGTLSDPYGGISHALGLVGNGLTLLLRNGSYDAPGLYTKPSIWRAHGGTAVIGQ